MDLSDENFKANYSAEVLGRRNTISLKTSFHLINVLLIGICKVFKDMDDQPEKITFIKGDQRLHKIDIKQFISEFKTLCFYDPTQHQNVNLTIVEHAPSTFYNLRKKFEVNSDLLFQSFVPLHNI